MSPRCPIWYQLVPNRVTHLDSMTERYGYKSAQDDVVKDAEGWKGELSGGQTS